jgi:capsular polysaccharide biosynthesis protein
LELRQYLAVVRRRWPLVALIVVLTALFSAGLLFTQRPTYTAIARLSIRQDSAADLAGTPVPTATAGAFTYDDYYSWGSSEYMADDYVQIIPSQAFAQLVSDQLKRQNIQLSRDAVAGTLSADRRHREISIAVSTGDRNTSSAIAQAAADALTAISAPGQAVPSLNGVVIHDHALFAELDVSSPDQAVSNQSRLRSNAAIAVVVGVALALALAFLVEYLDNSLRDSADAERVLGLPVLGTIPGRR